ncbi:MAG: sigma-54-dependent Fis family transcriptional regulator [Planctomycetes bacterium]|jgi:DNA-binding NtrC family response regulator|nr:sigma-54-dependent Fis family transcriptional regulator [Planctomycetota bacterium]MBT4029631.1 sigma-54-dependent Fis family transcriptional regulator [Planctomycetota bacterium]MBT4560174.1 sigma-54-dependent Fis family transcriptional regulator [Planctomycetota bacterium]MBT5100902.1 sigma-54-dependent Fis family transcriptional regulator [Planctomycetota bacterium]MBT5120867.1 sigma-54-dependent Fis family transcriptional regulator [Planctomycetota bacterium]
MPDPLNELEFLFDTLDLLPAAERVQAAHRMRLWAAAQAEAVPLPDAGLPSQYGMIGESTAMQTVFKLLGRMVRTDAPVLVLGESGTGKELVARALHDGGARRKSPFVAVNCAAISPQLLESELFGHVKGSFTGAHRDRKGYAEAADGGTLFLDEIGDMQSDLQAKLLRFLQAGEIRPVGGNVIKHVNVRIVAATNQDLLQNARAGAFREDLYYRLAVLVLNLPALREREGDVALLAQHILAHNEKDNLPTGKLSKSAVELLVGFDWPGNIRQLQNELTRAAAFATEGILEPEHFSADLTK